MASFRCSRVVAVAVVVAMQVAVAAIGAGPVHAYSYIVTTLADNFVEDGACTLREAILAANNDPRNADCGPGSAESDFIFFFQPGTIVLGAALPRITDGVHIVGHGAGGNTIDGNGRVRPFDIDSGFSSPFHVILERLTITNGKAPNSGWTLNSGLLSSEHGGAIRNYGRLDLRDVRVTHSTAGNGVSSACRCHTGDFEEATRGGEGGAVYNGGTLVGYRVTFDGNRAGEGGVNIYGNNVGGGWGGAIFNDVDATMTLFAATFTGNAQGRFGHGAAVFSRGLAIIKSSTFARNGIPGGSDNWSVVTDGVGVVAFSSTIMTDLQGCLAFGPGPGGAVDIGFNLGHVDRPGVGTCSFTPAAGSIVDSARLPVVDSELRNNGGFVPTLALILPTHPAINRVPASHEDCAQGKLTPLGLPFNLTDARGVARPQNGGCDMGAFELGPTFRRAQRTLAIIGAGSGHGTVTGDGLDCAIAEGAGSGQCAREYVTGTVVTATATAAAGSIFAGWEGDPECADGSVVLDGDKSCIAVFDLRGLSVTGSASRVGQVPAPGSAGGAQVKLAAKFAFDGVIDLSSATVAVDALLGEAAADGAGELVLGVPVVLRARPGGRSNAAIFETAPGVTPRVRVDVQIKQPSLSTIAVTVDRATLPRFPQLCSIALRPTTTLTAAFTIDDGINPPLTVTAREPWRCLDLMGGDLRRPRSLRTP